MRLFSRKTLALALTTTIAFPTSVLATNGYFLIGYGAKSRSMGGVGVAYAQDGLAAASNPAAMADIDAPTLRFDAGLELFIPKRSFRHDSATLESGFPGSDTGVNHKSDSNEFLIPSMGAIYKMNRKLTIGMAVIGNGANTRYNQQVPGFPDCMDGNVPADGQSRSTAFNFACLGSETAGVSLLQMQILPSVAYKVNRNNYIGASVAVAVQQFRAYGLQAFGKTTDGKGLGYTDSTGNLTNRGNDYSYGAGIRLGWLGKFFNDRLSLGANYSSRVYMTKFNKYENLFAEQGSFDIPANYTLGAAFKVTDKVTLAFDYEKILYSNIASIGNPGPDAANPSTFFPKGCKTLSDGSNSCLLGRDDGMGFGWHDANVYKVGVNYDYNTNWSVRAGYNYSEAPMDSDQILFNFLAPAVVEHHATLGFSYRPNKTMEWSFNYMHAFSNTVKGPTALGPSSAPVKGENGSAKMHIDSFGVSFGYKM